MVGMLPADISLPLNHSIRLSSSRSTCREGDPKRTEEPYVLKFEILTEQTRHLLKRYLDTKTRKIKHKSQVMYS